MGETLLPDKPSELVRLAIEDVKKVYRDDRYILNMNDWHVLEEYETDDLILAGYLKPNGYESEMEKCAVCFGGAVMAMTLDTDQEEYVSPDDFDKDTENKLASLDLFRRGNIRKGVAAFHGHRYWEASDLVAWEHLPQELEVRPTDDWEIIRQEEFLDDMEKVFAFLEGEGL